MYMRMYFPHIHAWLVIINLWVWKPLFIRYMNHLQSLKFENKLYAMVKDKMEEMQQHNMSWIEVQFLKKSLDILCECRRTLMYTYVFAYYLKKNNHSTMFEVTRQFNDLFNFKASSHYDICITSVCQPKIQSKRLWFGIAFLEFF